MLYDKNAFCPLTLSHSKKHGAGCSAFWQAYFSWKNGARCHWAVTAAEVSFLHYTHNCLKVVVVVFFCYFLTATTSGRQSDSFLPSGLDIQLHYFFLIILNFSVSLSVHIYCGKPCEYLCTSSDIVFSLYFLKSCLSQITQNQKLTYIFFFCLFVICIFSFCNFEINASAPTVPWRERGDKNNVGWSVVF